jgi:hypothetical protein
LGEGEGVAQVDGKGRFANAAFLVLDGDNHGAFFDLGLIRIPDFFWFYDSHYFRFYRNVVLQKY